MKPDNRSDAARVRSAWKKAEELGVIAMIEPYDRKRNVRFQMSDLGALSRELAKSGTASTNNRTKSDASPAATSAGQGMMDRLERIEERLNTLLADSGDAEQEESAASLHQVMMKIDLLDAKVNRLLSIWV